MTLDKQTPSSELPGSAVSMTARGTGLTQVLVLDRVELTDCKMQGWDFRDLAAFLRVQDVDWVQRTGV